VKRAVRVTVWPTTEFEGVAEIEVVLASAVVTDPAAAARATIGVRARINLIMAKADYVPANLKSGLYSSWKLRLHGPFLTFPTLKRLKICAAESPAPLRFAFWKPA
jgi:hypothetical protein